MFLTMTYLPIDDTSEGLNLICNVMTVRQNYLLLGITTDGSIF